MMAGVTDRLWMFDELYDAMSGESEWWHIAIVAVVAVLLFGKRVPELIDWFKRRFSS